MAKAKCPECPKCLPGWLVQFGDLMSLLLTFFILLLSMSVMDAKKVEEYFDLFRKSLGIIEDTAQDIREQTDAMSERESDTSDSDDDKTQEENENENVIQEVEEVMKEFNKDTDEKNPDIMDMTKGKNEFTLDIPSDLMFERGSYIISNKRSKRFLTKIARIIRTMSQSYSIEIIGHADRNFYKSKKIPRDNWDISALRAISVIKELIKNKIDPSMLKVAAFSSYQPKSDIPSQNRRVEIKFFTQDSTDDLLQEDDFFDKLDIE